MQEVEAVRCRERARELGVERAAAGQPQQLRQRAQPRLTGSGHGRGMRASPAAHPPKLRLRADEADKPSVRVLLILLVPVLVFSAWQFVRREENENRLALVASEIALRDVEVSCPGFWTRLVEITPNAGWVDFDEHGRPSDKTSLSATTLPRPRAGLAS